MPSDDVTRQEETISLAGADRALEAAMAEGAAAGASLAIAVVGSRGELIRLSRMDGAVELAVDNAIAKARAAINFKRDTDELFEYLRKDDALFPAMSSRQSILVVEGGKLFRRNGVIVGAIGISGAHHSVDHRCAEAAERALGL